MSTSRITGVSRLPRASHNTRGGGQTEGLLVESPTPYTCPWKGTAQYWSLKTDDGLIEDAAWSYPDLYDGAVERVGRDFAGHVAFGKDVSVVP